MNRTLRTTTKTHSRWVVIAALVAARIVALGLSSCSQSSGDCKAFGKDVCPSAPDTGSDDSGAPPEEDTGRGGGDSDVTEDSAAPDSVSSDTGSFDSGSPDTGARDTDACLAVGDPCSTDTDCCGGGTTNECVTLFGVGRVCAAICSSDAGCASGCCTRISGAPDACTIALWCASGDGCTATNTSGATCSADSDCCRDAADGYPSSCTCFGSACSCHALCTTGADCASGCCAVRTDGIRVCISPSDGTCL